MSRKRADKIEAPSDPLDRLFDAPKGKRTRLVAPLVLSACLLVICLINYRGIANNHLLNDDFIWLHDARHSMEFGNLLTHRVIGFFRPLVNFSFWAQERMFPGNIPYYNYFNLLLHFLNSLLVYQLVKLMLRQRTLAMAVAILFAISDDHSGAVFWISARTTLLASFFLLSSLVVLMSGPKRKRIALSASIGLYMLALAAKETAIVGFLLVAMIFVLTRKRSEAPVVGADAVISFAIVSALYFGLRLKVMGGLVQTNWGPGLHALRNIAGGAFNQLYPQPLFQLLYPQGARIPEYDNPVLLEILVLPAIALLLWLAVRWKKLYPMALAIGWMLLTLVPASFFQYRFLHYQSIQQTRYYYLSTIGAALVLAILLAKVWESRKGSWRLAVAGLFIAVCISCIKYNSIMDAKWESLSAAYQPYVSSVLKGPMKFPGISTLVVENSQMPFSYLEAAINYGNPQFALHEVTGGRESATKYKPCIYIWYTAQRGRVQVHYDAIR